jgi:Polyketide cyclase / dehydrase and lipid transport
MLHFWCGGHGSDPVTVHITRSLLIPAAPDRVWTTLADFSSISCWAPNVSHSSAASEAHDEVGAVRRVQVGRNALLERVTDWRLLEGLSYTIEGLPPDAGVVTTTWRIEPHGQASMTSVSTLIEPTGGPRGRIVGQVVARLLARAAGQMLQGLTDHLGER